jgi:hypothetical protein
MLGVLQQRIHLYGAEATLLGGPHLHLGLGGEFATAADSASMPVGRLLAVTRP